jgi:hypothetical protein
MTGKEHNYCKLSFLYLAQLRVTMKIIQIIKRTGIKQHYISLNMVQLSTYVYILCLCTPHMYYTSVHIIANTICD